VFEFAARRYGFREGALRPLGDGTNYARIREVVFPYYSFLNYYQNALTTAWLNDPWTQGSYSYATPGRAVGRQQLAQPLADQIFFAGEALSVEHCQTVNGAYLTGLAAANQVLAVLGRPPVSQAA
jgi:monoamine oxidase